MAGTTDSTRVVLKFKAVRLELVTDRLSDGRMIAAWLDAKGEAVRVLDPGLA
jgi:hypothetical protein